MRSERWSGGFAGRVVVAVLLAAGVAGWWPACPDCAAQEEAPPVTPPPMPGLPPLVPPGPQAQPKPQEEDPAVVGDLEEATYQMRVGNAEAAAKAYRRALEKRPENRRALFGLGTALISGGQSKEALEVLNRARGLFPADYAILNNLAWIYATAEDVTLRDGARAIALAREALLIVPQDHHVWSTLAEAYYVAGQYDQALRTAEEALNLARQRRLNEPALREYLRQVDKCRQAVRAMTILE